jgi:tRNA-dihydrouridine synthase 1
MTGDAHSAAANVWFSQILGSPRFICPPMVRQSELAFRLLVRGHGCLLAVSPMLVAEELVKNQTNMLQSCSEDRPLIVQICGNDPDTLLKAAKIVQSRCDGIDLNLGCPQDRARRGFFGAFLCDNPDLVVKCVEKLSCSIKVPISCKIRIFDSVEDTISFALRLEAAGCSMLTVHGRQRDQRHHIGPVNWEAIRRIKNALKIPVIGNGGIINREQAEFLIKMSGCDGIMAATAILSDPALFSRDTNPNDILDSDGHLELHHRLEMVRQYLVIAKRSPPLDPKSVRDHLIAMLRVWVRMHKDLFSVLNHRRLTSSVQFEALFMVVVDRLVGQASEKHDFNNGKNRLRIGIWVEYPEKKLWSLHEIIHYYDHSLEARLDTNETFYKSINVGILNLSVVDP